MRHSVRRHLRLEIDDYDAAIRRWIPGYETMLSVAAGAVASVDPGRVVDLGAGTGALSEALLLRESAVETVELVDVDEGMLDRARHRLARFGDRAAYRTGTFLDALPTCDAVAASLALHHVPTLEAKEAVFANVFGALRPGGVFVNADVTMPVDDDGRREAFGFWADHMVACGIDRDRAYAHFGEWAEEDTYLPLEAELEALRRLGFVAERVWSTGPIGVVVARKRGD